MTSFSKIFSITFIILLTLVVGSVFGQTPPELLAPPSQAPIDGGLFAAGAATVAYSIRKLRKKNN